LFEAIKKQRAVKYSSYFLKFCTLFSFGIVLVIVSYNKQKIFSKYIELFFLIQVQIFAGLGFY